jgi:hypothetical protein
MYLLLRLHVLVIIPFSRRWISNLARAFASVTPRRRLSAFRLLEDDRRPTSAPPRASLRECLRAAITLPCGSISPSSAAVDAESGGLVEGLRTCITCSPSDFRSFLSRILTTQNGSSVLLQALLVFCCTEETWCSNYFIALRKILRSFPQKQHRRRSRASNRATLLR